MRRAICTLLVLAALLAAGGRPAFADWKAEHVRRHNAAACPSTWWRGTDAARIAATRDLVVCEAKLFGVDVAMALDVADCESDFRPWLSYAGNGGVFQHRLKYWDGRQHLWAPEARGWRPSVFNARTNTVVSMRMVRAAGWSAWSCA